MPTLFDPTTLKPLSIAGLCVMGAIGLCLLLLLTQRGRSIYEQVENILARFAERRVLAACVLFLAVIGARLMALPLLPVPTPGVHDEFSYLLMADTFAHGRLTNPSHPLWLSFETFHVNFYPTYSSMYPPAQGLILAAGQLLGHPWIGVVLSNAVMCVVIFWALQGWMPARWAFLGAVITALKFGISSYWINSYWGGAAATIGGALVVGALGRLRKGVQAWDAVLLGLGAAILANSRPYEGAFFCIPVAIWFVYWLAGKRRTRESVQVRMRKGLLPMGCVLALTLVFMGYYNWRLTGNALLLPETLNMRAYDTAPLFLWQEPKPKLHYNNMAFQVFFNGWERSMYRRNWTEASITSRQRVELYNLAFLWTGAVLMVPGLLFTFRDRKMRILWWILAATAIAIFAVIWQAAHYAAPLVCVVYALLVQGLRHLRTMRVSGVTFGVALSRVVVMLLVLDTANHLSSRICDPQVFPCQGNPLRAQVVEKLEHLSGKQLVMVRYAELHNPHYEWVYNGADIDGAKIVWARELDAQQNAKLLAYFKGRSVWLVQPDNRTAEITPYIDTALAAKQ